MNLAKTSPTSLVSFSLGHFDPEPPITVSAAPPLAPTLACCPQRDRPDLTRGSAMAWGLCLPAWAWTESGRPGFGFSCIPHTVPSPEGALGLEGRGGQRRSHATWVTSQGRPFGPRSCRALGRNEAGTSPDLHSGPAPPDTGHVREDGCGWEGRREV